MNRQITASRLLLSGVLASSLLLAQCGGGGSDDDGGPVEPVNVAIVAAFPALAFDSPLFLAQAPGDDARVFVVTKPGLIQVFDRSGTAPAKVFLDLRSRIDDEGEQGLLGLAFDPDYADNGYFYVNYNPAGGARRTRIARYEVSGDPDLADAGSETELLSIAQPAHSNHKGGWIGFGPDDKLYVATGDGGGTGDPSNNAQNLNSLLGKILRLNRDGSVPADNPYVGDADRRGEIWAYGLRNPFRASFDRETGELWAGDVGQDVWEEIDLIGRGGNYGWRKFEGPDVYNEEDVEPVSHVLPVFSYDHAGGRCSIIGGHVYRGSALQGRAGSYIYADFCSGEVWAMTHSAMAAISIKLGAVPTQPTSFGEDADGELYLTGNNGNIYKLVPAP